MDVVQGTRQFWPCDGTRQFWPCSLTEKIQTTLLLGVALLSILFQEASGQQVQYELEANEDSAGGIFVIDFQKEGYTSTESWAEFNGTVDAEKYKDTGGLFTYTLCHRFQLYYTRPRMYLFTYAFDDQDTNELYSEYHLGRSAFRVCKVGTKFCAWHYEMPEYFIWRHICITYDAFRDSWKLYVNGEKIGSGSFAGDNRVEPIRPSGVTILGQDQDSVRGGYDPKQSWSGGITQFNLWDFSMEEYHIENLAECRSDAFGNVVRWDEPFWILGDVATKKVPIFELCDTEGDTASFFLFPDQFDFFFYNSFCVSLGGEMPSPASVEKYHEIMDVTEDLISGEIHEKCMHASGNIIVWVGITDQYEEGTWVNSVTKEDLMFDGFWEPGQPNGGDGQNCARTYLDRRWQSQSCENIFCAVCEFGQQMNLTMRGLCNRDTKLMEGFFDTEYFIKDYINLKPHWRGLGKSHIFYQPKEKKWKLESFYATEKYALITADDTQPQSFYPLGRKTWFVSDGICQLENDSPKSLTLTTCFPNKFTCDDGSCVRINQRCNLAIDCPDKSDEKNCEILVLGEDYLGELFPRELDNSALAVYVNVSILAFPKIDTLELFFTADFVLSLRWHDVRLQYTDLRGETALNSLNQQTQQSIWSPSLGFTNAKIIGGSKVDHITKTIVERNGEPIADNIERALEASVYSGGDGDLIMIREYFIDWTCDYDLLYYPFDTQICKMMFELNGITMEYVDLRPDELGVEYTGQRILLEYVVGDMLLKSMQNESGRKYSALKVSLALTRRWIWHLFGVFIQSILLLVVAYMTFYYRIDNFQDRIMVAITCMLVIANVQSSINEDIPKTSYVKMIDYFLLYAFNIIIIVMIYHTYQAAHIAEEFTPNEDDLQFEKIRKIAVEPNGNEMIQQLFQQEGLVNKLAEAKRINKQGQVAFVVSFLFFQIVFWSVALSEYFSEKDIVMLTKMHEETEMQNKMRVL